MLNVFDTIYHEPVENVVLENATYKIECNIINFVSSLSIILFSQFLNSMLAMLFWRK